MFRDILAVLSEESGAAGAVSVSFARHFGAFVTALAYGPAPELAAAALADLEYGAFLVGAPEYRDAAKARLAGFEARAKNAGIDYALIAPDEGEGALPPRLSHVARCFDLVVMEQPERNHAPLGGGEIGSMLIHSGRPVITAPYIQRTPPEFERVAIAWDASACAARALAAAMPALRQARVVEVITAWDSKARSAVGDGAEIIRHLSRHGVAASFKHLPSGGDPANLLLSHIADSGADMIVAGAYGHSRVTEAVFGGFTRTLLESMTVPLLMAH